MATGAYDNGKGSAYPLTKMNFLVTVDSIAGTAAFSEVTGIEATVDMFTREFNPLAKIAKDCGSAATFVCSMIAVASSLFVFAPYIYHAIEKLL